jgi:protoporphyrin/coproporphyrin ferrochelatase
MNGMGRGIALLNMGSPESPDDIQRFLFRLFSDPEIFRFPGGKVFRPVFARIISTLRSPRVRKRYGAIGGVSPLLKITRKQCVALEKALGEMGVPMPVEVCMRYSHPFSREAVAKLVERGAREIIGMPLYPQFSTGTTGSSLSDLRKAVAETCPGVLLREIPHWFEDASYHAAVAGRILSCLENLREAEETGVLFLAHSIPERFHREGDPYIGQVRETVSGIVKILQKDRQEEISWWLAYQGQVGPVRWVGPTVVQGLSTMKEKGIVGVVVAPVSFVSDHLETLHEIDIEAREMAREIGMKEFVRIPALNESEDFVRALAALICRRLGLGETRSVAPAKGF